MSTANKLLYLGETKLILKDTINMSNANITNSTTFRNYATQLKEGYIDILNNGTDTLYNNFTHLTGKGMTLSFAPTYQAPMKISCYGSTSQASTPTPSIPVDVVTTTGNQSIEICKTNLAYTDWASDFVSRINDNTKAKLETKDTRSCLWYAKNAGYGEYDTKYMFKRKWKENTQYTFSFDIFCVDTVYCNLDIEYTDGTVTELLVGNNDMNIWAHKVATSASGKTIKYLKPRWRNNSCYIDINTFMVYEGTDTTTPYETYNGTNYNIGLGNIELCKIGDYEDKIDKSTGKNKMPIIDGTVSLNGITITVKDGYVIINGTSTASQSFKLTNGLEGKEGNPESDWLSESCISNKNNTTFSLRYISGTGETSACAFRLFADSSSYLQQYYPTQSEQTTTFSTNGGISCLTFFTTNGRVFNNYKFAIQLESGNSVTDYEPYGTGNWYIKKNIGKVVLNGSENWNYQSSSNIPYRISCADFKYQTDQSATPLVLCDYYVTKSWNTASSVIYSITSNPSSSILCFRNRNITSLEDWKTWLTTHNTTVYYVLATPTYTKITDSTLIEQLEAIKSKDNTTNITSSMVIGAIALKKE